MNDFLILVLLLLVMGAVAVLYKRQVVSKTAATGLLLFLSVAAICLRAKGGISTATAALLLLVAIGVLTYLWTEKIKELNNSANVKRREDEEDEENEDVQKSSYDLEANPQSVLQSEWVKYLTGMPEPELREGENIVDVIKAESVPKYGTHRFTFVNKHTKVEHDAGYFYTESIGDMQEEFDKMPEDKGVPKGCKFIVDLRQDYKSTKYVDVAYMQSLEENNRAMFQVASNFNGVEAISEMSFPDGDYFITNYINDNTQGPAASISAGGAAIARVLLPFYDKDTDPSRWRQTSERQVEFLEDLKEYCSVDNGYIVQNGSEAEPPEDGWELVKRVRVGVQVDAQVSFCGTNAWNQQMAVVPAAAGQRVSQVFCAAMNLCQRASGRANAERPTSARLAALLLEGAYRGTYFAALRHKVPRLYLTLIGGGVFGNDTDVILNTVEKVHLEIACCEKNTTLQEVHLVLFNEPRGMIDFLHRLQNNGVYAEIHAYKDETRIIYKNF